MPTVTITVNGKPETREVENRTLLVSSCASISV